MEASKTVTRKTSNFVRAIAFILISCVAAVSLVMSIILLNQIEQLNNDKLEMSSKVTQLKNDKEHLSSDIAQLSGDIAQLKGRIEQLQEKAAESSPVFTAAQPVLSFNYNDRSKDSYNGYIQISCSDKNAKYVVMAEVSMLFNGVVSSSNHEQYYFSGIAGGSGIININGSGKKGALINPECKIEIIGYIKFEDFKN
jgi:outer membrane murein-binding lipoprotein Lpp